MTSDRKNPGVAFWATMVVTLAVVVYPLSWGPACWLAEQKILPHWIVTKGYVPVIWIYYWGPKPARRAVGWWAGFARPGYTTLEMHIEDDALLREFWRF